MSTSKSKQAQPSGLVKPSSTKARSIAQPGGLFMLVMAATIYIAAGPVIAAYLLGRDNPPSMEAMPPLTSYRYQVRTTIAYIRSERQKLIISLRTGKDGEFFGFKHARKDPLHYVVLHAMPACLWVTLMPLQFIAKLRRSYPTIHRISGYTALTCSLVLIASGLAFVPRNMSFGPHPPQSLTTLHKMGPLPIYFGTFDHALVVVSILMLGTLVPTLQYARQRDFARHRQWAIYHAMSGYVIPLQRWGMLTVSATGGVLHQLRKMHVLSEKTMAWLQLPANMSRKRMEAAEMAGFAFTTWLALFYAWVLLRRLTRTRGALSSKTS